MAGGKCNLTCGCGNVTIRLNGPPRAFDDVRVKERLNRGDLRRGELSLAGVTTLWDGLVVATNLTMDYRVLRLHRCYGCDQDVYVHSEQDTRGVLLLPAASEKAEGESTGSSLNSLFRIRLRADGPVAPTRAEKASAAVLRDSESARSALDQFIAREKAATAERIRLFVVSEEASLEQRLSKARQEAALLHRKLEDASHMRTKASFGSENDKPPVKREPEPPKREPEPPKREPEPPKREPEPIKVEPNANTKLNPNPNTNPSNSLAKLEPRVDDSKINDSKINDSKINDSKINDSKINDSKSKTKEEEDVLDELDMVPPMLQLEVETKDVSNGTDAMAKQLDLELEKLQEEKWAIRRNPELLGSHPTAPARVNPHDGIARSLPMNIGPRPSQIQAALARNEKKAEDSKAEDPTSSASKENDSDEDIPFEQPHLLYARTFQESNAFPHKPDQRVS